MIRQRFNAGGLAVLLVGATVGLAACGGGSSGNSSTGTTTSGSGGTDVSAQSASSNKAEKYAQCMRSHGVPNFPDPVNGQLQLRVTKGSGLNPDSPQFKSAQRACQSLAPAKLGSGQINTQTQAKLLQFAACMRSHGVPKFPDPSSGGGAVKITSGQGVDPNSPQFQSAMKTCRKMLPGGGPGTAQAG